jgi:hypothetical protein
MIHFSVHEDPRISIPYSILVLSWNEEVATLIIGSHFATHFVEESSFRMRTRTFDLWAWCSNSNMVPRVAWLTITDPANEELSIL